VKIRGHRERGNKEGPDVCMYSRVLKRVRRSSVGHVGAVGAESLPLLVWICITGEFLSAWFHAVLLYDPTLLVKKIKLKHRYAFLCS
jgi:hypothetical protein